ncbi:hypothetical protein GCM10011391_14800 [Pullulanibacillus camelliae]|uniref:Xylose isomerase-like TIM barrel domain-containing protein n=1 Tax=Pullulanibacillus camelliae TaxID=1707096 RepID=A0A8J2VVK6_9BACL|nr:sugar phosphate isomerase/epimerase [Pullulanibacillus camelliae]GGE36952.1 hypothetical protein GCM10011391_14800 [Pullulanibacillus camelliae]
MIKLGVNSVLFKDFDFPTAARHIALSGYSGIEIAAIKGMCEHLVLERWREQVKDIQSCVTENGLELLAMEVASLDEDRLTKAFEAAATLGIPVVNVGPGGKAGVEEDLSTSIETLDHLAKKAERYGVTLCVKAHFGNAIHDTPTTLRAMEAISSPAFGIDMDPSHIYRSDEVPDQSLAQVMDRVKHIHIRDCKGRSQGPGPIQDQACGRGDINLFAYCQQMVKDHYSGPVCLEVIGAKGHSLAEVSMIAAESYGYLNACFKVLESQNSSVERI